MPAPTSGLHHVTAVASDPKANYAFYTDTLGLRMVKRSVNQDDTSVYHLFYADHTGSPGTSMTFFPYGPETRPGQVGTGQASVTAFVVPADAIDYWTDRLEADGSVDGVRTFDRFGDEVVAFEDPDGLPLELVGRADAPEPNLPESPVPEEHAIRGFFGVTLSLASAEPTASLLEEMGYTETESDDDEHRTRFESDGVLGYAVDVLTDPNAPQGRPGAGTVHHVAFQVEDDEQESWRELLIGQGLRPTEIIDRKWFMSVYTRTQGGVLFEFATESPGYAVDEPVATLGEKLMLPEWLEDRREEIESGLGDLE